MLQKKFMKLRPKLCPKKSMKQKVALTYKYKHFKNKLTLKRESFKIDKVTDTKEMFLLPTHQKKRALKKELYAQN